MSVFVLLLGWFFEYQVHNILISIIFGVGVGYLISSVFKWPRSRAGEKWAVFLMIISPFLGPTTRLLEYQDFIIHCNVFLFAMFLILSIRRRQSKTVLMFDTGSSSQR